MSRPCNDPRHDTPCDYDNCLACQMEGCEPGEEEHDKAENTTM